MFLGVTCSSWGFTYLLWTGLADFLTSNYIKTTLSQCYFKVGMILNPYEVNVFCLPAERIEDSSGYASNIHII